MELITSTTFEDALEKLPEAQRALVKQLMALLEGQSVIVAVEALTNLLCVIGVQHDQLVQIRDWFNESINVNIARNLGKQMKGKADA